MTAAAFQPDRFQARAKAALADGDLQQALGRATSVLGALRSGARDALPEFDALRDHARALRDHHLEHLPHLARRFEIQVRSRGGHVFHARTARDANNEIQRICQAAGARTVVKSKSMVSEEIGLTAALESAGFQAVETDLGEYIVQLRDEQPSHIIAPALHLNRHEVADTFRAAHPSLPPERPLLTRRALVREARTELRARFAEAEVGITGANFLIAETGSIVLVTNEGNADLAVNLPRTHIVVVGVEKLVETFEDAAVLVRLLGRSACGQEMTTYTTILTGPARPGEEDGPSELHVILLDNGRSALLGGEFQAMLRCIRCGACLNHCPVYSAIGGHAYGSIYPGPMGAVLTPAFTSARRAEALPSASTFCGRCEDVCPVRIPLPALMRRWREAALEQGPPAAPTRATLRLWSWLCRHPRLYRLALDIAGAALRSSGPGPYVRILPPPASAWTQHRDLAKPAGPSFQSQLAGARA